MLHEQRNMAAKAKIVFLISHTLLPKAVCEQRSYSENRSKPILFVKTKKVWCRSAHYLEALVNPQL